MLNRPKIVVVGSSNSDMIISLDRIPKPGETVIGGKFSIAAGGKGANQAVSAARAGGDVVLVARVGRDHLGDQAVAGFIHEGIHVDYVYRDDISPSGVAFIFVARNGENSIAVASGANERLSPSDVVNASDAFTEASVLLVQLEVPLEAVQKAAELAHQAGARIILNPAPASELPDTLLRIVSVLTPNEHETEMLTGIKVDSESSARRAAQVLLSRGVQSVIITLGAHGVFLAQNDRYQHYPSYQVQAVDCTAAGDTFNGALALMLANESPLDEAIHFAQAAAALSVTKLGAQTSVPTLDEIMRFQYS